MVIDCRHRFKNDAIVYGLYGIADEERKIIESRLE